MRQRHFISIHFKDNKISKNDFIHHCCPLKNVDDNIKFNN